MLNEHYHGITETSDPVVAPAKEEEDDIPFDDIETSSKTDSESTVDDNKVKELLDSLD